MAESLAAAKSSFDASPGTIHTFDWQPSRRRSSVFHSSGNGGSRPRSIRVLVARTSRRTARTRRRSRPGPRRRWFEREGEIGHCSIAVKPPPVGRGLGVRCGRVAESTSMETSMRRRQLALFRRTLIRRFGATFSGGGRRECRLVSAPYPCGVSSSKRSSAAGRGWRRRGRNRAPSSPRCVRPPTPGCAHRRRSTRRARTTQPDLLQRAEA